MNIGFSPDVIIVQKSMTPADIVRDVVNVLQLGAVSFSEENNSSNVLVRVRELQQGQRIMKAFGLDLPTKSFDIAIPKEVIKKILFSYGNNMDKFLGSIDPKLSESKEKPLEQRFKEFVEGKGREHFPIFNGITIRCNNEKNHFDAIKPSGSSVDPSELIKIFSEFGIRSQGKTFLANRKPAPGVLPYSKLGFEITDPAGLRGKLDKYELFPSQPLVASASQEVATSVNDPAPSVKVPN